MVEGEARQRFADLGVAGHDGDLLLVERLGEHVAIKSVVAGVISDGLSITRLPAASAVASGVKARDTGKFHGETMPTTPSGW